MSEESAQNVVVSPTSTIVDLDLDPPSFVDWTIESHTRGGKIDVAKTKIGLCLSEAQKIGMWGKTLRKELQDKPVLNINLLTFYLAHPSLIPEDWKEKQIFFWGTIRRDPLGGLWVGYMYWSGEHWWWDHRLILLNRWSSNHYAAIIEP